MKFKLDNTSNNENPVVEEKKDDVSLIDKLLVIATDQLCIISSMISSLKDTIDNISRLNEKHD